MTSDSVPRCQQADPKKKTTYVEPAQPIRTRDHPTYQSSIFTGHNYERRGGDQKRYQRIKIDQLLRFWEILLDQKE